MNVGLNQCLAAISRQNIIKIAFVAMAATIFGASGCSKGKTPWEQTYPAKGIVKYKGKPIANAELAFLPTDAEAPDAVRPKAKTAADGKFEVWTYQSGDGIPAGTYKVTIVHNEVAVSKGTIVAKPNSLPAKYARFDTTDLSVPITAGENELPAFELN